MTNTRAGDLLGKNSVFALTGDSGNGVDLDRRPALGTADKIVLAAAAVVAYGVAHYVLKIAGLPAVPGVSSLLLLDQPFYALPLVAALLPLLTWVLRGFVRRVAFEAPLFCAALGLLALPTHGGDSRNALLDAGGAGAYPRMIVEQGLLAAVIFVAYACLVRRDHAPSEGLTMPAGNDDVSDDDASTAGERAVAVLSQTGLTLALLWLLGQSPVKGQALLGVAVAGGLASFSLYKMQGVRGSLWYVAGLMLAGAVAYAWAWFHPDGAAIGDAIGLFAAPSRVLPLHYATAGVAGTIYGYWAGRAVEVEEG